MMQRLINQIYWSSRNFFANGTRMVMTKGHRVAFHNSLMAPGRSIIHWDSSLNYQADKTVPQLPILKVGQEYRLVAHLETQPADSYIIRLIFRDIQGSELKRIDVRSKQRKFIFPEGAVTYSIEIINSGCYDLQFDRLEIGPANLPLEAYGDIWVHKQVNKVTPDRPLNIILVGDGKQARRTQAGISNFYTELPIQVISISWQFNGNLDKWLSDWIDKQKISDFHIVSGSSRFDKVAIDVAQKYPRAEVMATKPVKESTVSHHVWQHAYNSWSNPNITDVDWQDIIYEMKNVWEGGES